LDKVNWAKPTASAAVISGHVAFIDALPRSIFLQAADQYPSKNREARCVRVSDILPLTAADGNRHVRFVLQTPLVCVG
jgi:hypothetical protein